MTDGGPTLAEANALDVRRLRLYGAGSLAGGLAFAGLVTVLSPLFAAAAVTALGVGVWAVGKTVEPLSKASVGVLAAGAIPLLEAVFGTPIDPVFAAGFFVVLGLVAVLFAPWLSGYAGLDDQGGRI